MARPSSGDEGLSVFAIEGTAPGVIVNRLPTMADDGQCEVILENVTVPAANVIGPVNGAATALQRHLERAAVLTCLAAVGGSDRVLELTTEYAKDRVQFGKPIGTFQAISHKCADMAIDLDGMRFVVYHAAWLLSEGQPAAFEVSAAKAWTADAYQRITASGHQVMGGIGFTKANDMQMYYRRSKAAAQTLGNADLHRELVARSLDL